MLDIQCLQFTLSRSKDNTSLNILKVLKRRQWVKQRRLPSIFRIFEILIIYICFGVATCGLDVVDSVFKFVYCQRHLDFFLK